MIYFFVDEAYEALVRKEPLIRAAEETLRVENHSDSDVTISIQNDEALKSLNAQFMGTEAPTDVLSFTMDFFDPETERQYLGDILISYERAEEQAQTAGHSTENELILLIVHGILHLVGYDHGTEEEKSKMWKTQSEILKQLGCEIKRLPE
ncbi:MULTISPECIES: rRNA maturation RNase YbeY [Anaerolinea]|uniref:Endoribonuclease YbeY n=1 Tax=Anaerolinea thermophila (strain DSM 14523 / JCM 11388 / NBRC 100420 / UNI-1) TaxID=926569 RepID=E8N4U7_ANATU|nr:MULTISPECIES: rRNA maturation RNase YbeY [Anaerolinea]BAJ63461.1 hypothetical protein ANT_14330 [Anaerolinea thermophila UNI-1]